MNPSSLLRDIQPLFGFLGQKRKQQLIWLFVLMTIVGLSEVVGIASIVPFLMALTNMDNLFNHPKVQPFLSFLPITNAQELLALVIIIFILITVITNLLRVLAIYIQNELAGRISRDLSSQVYAKLVCQPYLFYASHHTSEILQSITYANLLASSFFMPLLLILTNSIVILALFIGLLLIDGKVALVATLVLVSTYAMLYQWRKSQLQLNSQIVTDANRELNQITIESLGAIKDILLAGQQPFFTSTYNHLTGKINQAQANNQTIFLTPRYIVEVVAITSIALLALAIGNRGIPVLGSFALAANRLLPAFQQVFGNLASIQSYREQLRIIVKDLSRTIDPLQQLSATAPLAFHGQLTLEQIWFRYSASDRWILQDLSLTIPARSRVGFVGTTGSGKSTTADLILGLLPPAKGQVLVDGLALEGERLRAWQMTIAHVPQAIFIADTTIMENIAYGLPKHQIDPQKLAHAARLAQLEEFIHSLPQNYHTKVGERGVRLSGGQRQRLGIARALYRQAQVIVFDEATSALDNSTERELMHAINSLSQHLTVIMIAHRLTTIEKCDRIFEFDQGRIIHTGTYQELLAKSPTFQKMAYSI